MIKVRFLGPLAQSHQNELMMDVSDFAALKAALNALPGIDQALLASSAIALNDKLIADPTTLRFKDGDVVCILPPVCGG